MTSPSGWPDPARVVPPPEFAKVEWHWIDHNDGTFDLLRWREWYAWDNAYGGFKGSPDTLAKFGWRYHSPCIPATTPDPRDTELTTLRAEVDRLRMRERVCDSQCGASQYDADEWYRAEKEFDLSDDTPYQAIKRLRVEIATAHASGLAEGHALGVAAAAALCVATGLENTKAADLEWDAIKSDKLLWRGITANGLATAIRAIKMGEG